MSAYPSTEGFESEGRILRIERSSIHDGDGFRTVIFLKGCPLCCVWCSTPESQSSEIQHCEDGTVYGMDMTVAEVMKEIRKDLPFFFHSGGGMTMSGGEILMQPDFTRDLLKACKRELIDTCIETSFYSKWENIESILPYVNTAFVDLKLIDKTAHKKYCCGDNDLIKENLLKTNDIDFNGRLILRTPIVPGINNTVEELRGIGEFAKKLKHLTYIQLLAYHRLGTNTYTRLGIPYTLADVVPPTPQEMEDYKNIVREYGMEVK